MRSLITGYTVIRESLSTATGATVVLYYFRRTRLMDQVQVGPHSSSGVSL